MSTAIVCILVGLIFIGVSIVLSDRSRRKFDEPPELTPEPKPVLADLSGIPTVHLIMARSRLVDALAIPLQAQTRSGLCNLVDNYRITTKCIKVWAENEGCNYYPVEYKLGDQPMVAFTKFESDHYKMQNPKRRRLAHFMIKCIEYELDERQDETR